MKKGRVRPSTLIVSSRRSSLFWRWKAAVTVLFSLTFSFYFWRYKHSVFMSWVRVPSNVCQSPEEVTCITLNKRGARTEPCGTPSLRRRNLLLYGPLPVAGVKLRFRTSSMIKGNHVPVWKQAQKFAGEVAVPHGVVDCCEIDKHSTCLLS